MRARSIAAQRQRTLNTELMETDIAVYKLAYRKLAPAFKTVTSYISAGGALCRDSLFDMGLVDTKRCPFCDCYIQTIDHTLFFCQHPDLVVARAWQAGDPINLDSIAQEIFPAWLRLGMPKAMANTISGTCWGTPLTEVNLRTRRPWRRHEVANGVG